MRAAMPSPSNRATGKATRLAASIARTAATVSRLGSPGPTPTRVRPGVVQPEFAVGTGESRLSGKDGKAE